LKEAQVLDHYLNIAQVTTRCLWDSELNYKEIKRKNSFVVAMTASTKSISEYVDCHCTVWTVESFSCIWSDLSTAGLLGVYQLQQIFEPVRFGNDFVVILKVT
jgi:hypothetical protein